VRFLVLFLLVVGPIQTVAGDDLSLLGSPRASSGSVSAELSEAGAGANLMPVVRPDPTVASLTLTLTNAGSEDIARVTLVDAFIEGTGGTKHPLSMKPRWGGTVSVAAGQTITAQFVHQVTEEKTPVPFPCRDKVQIRTRVAFDQTEIGPLTSARFSFECIGR